MDNLRSKQYADTQITASAVLFATLARLRDSFTPCTVHLHLPDTPNGWWKCKSTSSKSKQAWMTQVLHIKDYLQVG